MRKKDPEYNAFIDYSRWKRGCILSSGQRGEHEAEAVTGQFGHACAAALKAGIFENNGVRLEALAIVLIDFTVPQRPEQYTLSPTGQSPLSSNNVKA